MLQAVARMKMLSGDGSRATSLQPPLAARPPQNIDARKFQIFMHPSQSARAAVHPASSWIGQTREPGRSRRAQERTPLPSQAKNSYFARRFLRPQCRYIAAHLRGPPWTNCRHTPQTNCRLRLESTFGGGCENCERPPQKISFGQTVNLPFGLGRAHRAPCAPCDANWPAQLRRCCYLRKARFPHTNNPASFWRVR